MDSEDAAPLLEDLPQRLRDRHLWHYAEIGDIPQVPKPYLILETLSNFS